VTDPRPKQPRWAVYGLVQILWLALCTLNTRIFFPGCTLIRLPVFLRGRRRIAFGRNFVCGYLGRLDATGAPGCLRFGSDVQINDFVHIGAQECVSIGNNVLIASRVFISDHDHGSYGDTPDCSSPDEPPMARSLRVRPVHIGDNVWIGEGASVLSGVTIGAGSIIGAGAVVTQDIPADSIAVGVPARVVRRFDRSSGRWQPVRP
jgi:lipopolysaccharide O-acetyltransferase